MDEAHNKTDAIIEQFQKNAEYTYAIAEKKAKLKLDAYLHNARREDILQRKKYKDGEINKSEAARLCGMPLTTFSRKSVATRNVMGYSVA